MSMKSISALFEIAPKIVHVHSHAKLNNSGKAFRAFANLLSLLCTISFRNIMHVYSHIIIFN